jgi:glycosyltransferase involved in cell wall biosynthesis
VLGRPGWVAQTDVAQFRQRVRSLSFEWRPDVVHIAYHVMGQYADDVPADAARVLTQYDPGVTAARDAARQLRGLRRVRAWLEVAAWSRYERRVIGTMDRVIVFTESDRRAVESLGNNGAIVKIPLGTTIPAEPLNPYGRDRSVLFVGNFIHPPNVDAAFRLMRSIFPAVHRARPDTRLVIVGANPPDDIQRLARGPITVTGAVESVVPYLDAAAVVVAPIAHGGGMRVKVLEALAAGKAVVASPLAAAGLEVGDGKQLLLAADDAAFTSATIDLLDDPASRAALAGRARAWAAAHVGWQSTISQYEALQMELLRRKDATVEAATLSSSLISTL